MISTTSKTKLVLIKVVQVIAFSLLLLPAVLAQTTRIDSLKRELSTSKTRSFETLFELARAYGTIDSKSALLYAREAKSIAILAQDSVCIVKSFRLLGQIHRRLNDLDSSIYFFQEGLPIAERIQNYEELYSILNGIGITLNFQAKYDESLDRNLQALDLAYSKMDSVGISMSLLNLGFIYYKLMDYKIALDYYNKSLAIRTAINETYGSELLTVNISLCEVYLGKVDEARRRLIPLLRMCQSGCSDDLTTQLYLASGIIWDKLESALNAEKDFLVSYSHAKKINDTRLIVENITFLSEMCMRKGNFDEAERFLKEGALLAKGKLFKLERIKLLEKFCRLYHTKGAYEQLTDYQRMLINLKDSVYNEKHTSNLMQLHAELAEKENKTRLASQEQLLAAKYEIIAKQRSINLLIGLVIVALALLIYFLIRIFQDRKKTNALLNKKVLERTAELKKNYDAMRLAIEQRNAAIAKLSNDLQTSLNSMQALCAAGLKTESDSIASRYFDEIDSTTQRLSNSFNNILMESKIAS